MQKVKIGAVETITLDDKATGFTFSFFVGVDPLTKSWYVFTDPRTRTDPHFCLRAESHEDAVQKGVQIINEFIKEVTKQSDNKS